MVLTRCSNSLQLVGLAAPARLAPPRRKAVAVANVLIIKIPITEIKFRNAHGHEVDGPQAAMKASLQRVPEKLKHFSDKNSLQNKKLKHGLQFVGCGQ
jgi:hypothetical protein